MNVCRHLAVYLAGRQQMTKCRATTRANDDGGVHARAGPLIGARGPESWGDASPGDYALQCLQWLVEKSCATKEGRLLNLVSRSKRPKEHQ